MQRDDDRTPSKSLPQSDAGPFATDTGSAETFLITIPGTPPHPAATTPNASNWWRRSPVPVPPGVPYHRVLAGEKRRIARGVVALTLLLGGLFLFGGVFAVLGMHIDSMLGRTSPIHGGTEFTPVYHGANLIAIALLIPWSMVIQRWLYGVKGASLHSVRSVFRLDVFSKAFLSIAPIWAVYIVVFFLLSPHREIAWRLSDLLGVFVVTLLLAPLQSAGEEYGLRGLAFRIAASWSRGTRTALVIGAVVSSLLFMAIHVSSDPWLNIYYFTFGFTLALITWRTGGLETAVVVHATNNTLAYLVGLVAHTDFVSGSDRSAGTGSVVMLLPCVLLIAIAAVVWRRTQRTGPALTPLDG